MRHGEPPWFKLLGGLATWCIVAAVSGSSAAQAGTFRVLVKDARTGVPVSGAFVQVGQAPGSPFSNNWGWTGSDGRIQFTDPGILGRQTVTAGSEGKALLTVVGAAEDSITLALHPMTNSSSLPEPRAEIGGTVNGISTQTNDGNLDVGLVYPAVRLSDILASRSLPIEVPSDTVSFPLVGPTVLPGNLVIPTQVELLFLTFAKTHYHFFVPDDANYDLLVVSGRLPISGFGSPGLPIGQLTMREIGAERSIAVHGDLTLNLDSDLDLSHTLTVQVPEAPNGSEVFAAAVADLPWAGSTRSFFFDAKTALRDTLSLFHLSGMNPAGDLIDAVPYLAGYYADSSGAGLYQSGRVDRSPLTLPATRALGSFFLVPQLTQVADVYEWSDVARPGVTPDPTWAIATFRVEPSVPGDSTVTPRTLWEAWIPAGQRSLRLPILALGAPGGLPDPNQTPEGDHLVWDLWVADPAGGISSVMEDAFSSLTTWSRRTTPIESPAVETEEVSLGTLSDRGLKFRLAPNPARSEPDIRWQSPLPLGAVVAWSIWDPAGRLRASGRFRSSGSAWERRVLGGTERLPAGVYWVRLLVGERFGSVPLIIAR
jgi:hypothetical protein